MFFFCKFRLIALIHRVVVLGVDHSESACLCDRHVIEATLEQVASLKLRTLSLRMLIVAVVVAVLEHGDEAIDLFDEFFVVSHCKYLPFLEQITIFEEALLWHLRLARCESFRLWLIRQSLSSLRGVFRVGISKGRRENVIEGFTVVQELRPRSQLLNSSLYFYEEFLAGLGCGRT